MCKRNQAERRQITEKCLTYTHIKDRDQILSYKGHEVKQEIEM